MATATASLVDQISYTDLYARWERGNWCRDRARLLR